MPHLDEGTLNAWLDGELGPRTGAEGRSVAEHLESCSRCRTRLEAERTARERAASILAAADLPVPDAPPFGSIGNRARKRGAPGRKLPRLGLAWAASIAVAVSAGLLARELSNRHGEDLPAALQSEREQVQAAPDVPAEGAQAKVAEPRSLQEPRKEEPLRQKSTEPVRREDAVEPAAEAPAAGRFDAEVPETGAIAAVGCWRVTDGQVSSGLPDSFRLSLDPAAGEEGSRRIFALTATGEPLSGVASWHAVGADSVSLVFPGFIGRLRLEGDELRGEIRLRPDDEQAAEQAGWEGATRVRLERTECRAP